MLFLIHFASLFCTENDNEDDDLFIEVFHAAMKKQLELDNILTHEKAINFFIFLVLNVDSLMPDDEKFRHIDAFLKGKTSDWDGFYHDLEILPRNPTAVQNYFKENHEKLVNIFEQNGNFVRSISYMSGSDLDDEFYNDLEEEIDR